jgi:hypothetical protein
MLLDHSANQEETNHWQLCPQHVSLKEKKWHLSPAHVSISKRKDHERRHHFFKAWTFEALTGNGFL